MAENVMVRIAEINIEVPLAEFYIDVEFIGAESDRPETDAAPERQTARAGEQPRPTRRPDS